MPEPAGYPAHEHTECELSGPAMSFRPLGSQ